MKKIIVILVSVIAMLAFSVNAKAQLDSWMYQNKNGDAMLDEKDYALYFYGSSDGQVAEIRAYEGEPITSIMVRRNKFQFGENRGQVITGIIGFYDENKNFLSKEEVAFCIGDELSKATCKSEALIKYLKNTNGYIRIRIPFYKEGYFDMTFPTFRVQEPKDINSLF